jgi:hypothetical protein
MATKEEEMDEHTASLGVLAGIPWWIKSKRDSRADPPITTATATKIMILFNRNIMIEHERAKGIKLTPSCTQVAS